MLKRPINLLQRFSFAKVKVQLPKRPENPTTSNMNVETFVIESQSYKNTEPCFKPEVEARIVSTDTKKHVNGMKNFEDMISDILTKSPSVSSGSFNSEKENSNKRKISCSERLKSVKKFHQKDQNSSIKFKTSSPLNGFKHMKPKDNKSKNNSAKSPKKLSLCERFKNAKSLHQNRQNGSKSSKLKKPSGVRRKMSTFLSNLLYCSDSEDEIVQPYNKHLHCNLLDSSSDSESEMPPIKCLAQSTPIVRKEVKTNDNKVIVIDSSDSELSDNCAENDVSFSSDSEIKFPIKCVADSIVNKNIPKLKEPEEISFPIKCVAESTPIVNKKILNLEEPEEISKDNDVIVQSKNNGSASSNSYEQQDDIQPVCTKLDSQTAADKIELNNSSESFLNEIISQPESSILSTSYETEEFLPSDLIPIPNLDNSQLNRTYMFHNRVRFNIIFI